MTSEPFPQSTSGNLYRAMSAGAGACELSYHVNWIGPRQSLAGNSNLQIYCAGKLLKSCPLEVATTLVGFFSAVPLKTILTL